MTLTLRHHVVPPVSEAAVRRAWQRYLRETREASADRYPAIEERAWMRLSSNLAALGARLRSPDEAAQE